MFHKHKEAQQSCKPHNLPLLRAAQQREMEVKFSWYFLLHNILELSLSAACVNLPAVAYAAFIQIQNDFEFKLIPPITGFYAWIIIICGDLLVAPPTCPHTTYSTPLPLAPLALHSLPWVRIVVLLEPQLPALSSYPRQGFFFFLLLNGEKALSCT